MSGSPPQAWQEMGRLLAALADPHALREAGVLLLAVLLAAAVVALGRRAAPQRGQALVGRQVVDGALFPLLAFVFAALGQRLAFPGQGELVVFRIALPILLSLALIRGVVHVLHAALPESGWVRLAERSLSWVVWAAVVLWVTGVLPVMLEEMDQIAWTLGGKPITLRKLLEGVLSASLVLVLALWISAALEARLLAGARGESLSLRKVAANVLRAGLMFVGLLVALSAAGIDLTALGVLGGAVGVGIGFGLQKLASNYVSGFVILAERSVRIGDWVRIDNFEGRITDITTRFTTVRAASGRESLVPNEMLITQRVENLSLADPNVLLQTVLQVAYGTDVRALRDAIAEVVRGVPRVLSDPGPAVSLSAFASDGLEITVSFWIADPENGQGNVRGEVNLALLEMLEARGVEIPFPQRVLRRASAPARGA